MMTSVNRERVERWCNVHISSSHHHISRLHEEEQTVFGEVGAVRLEEIERVHREMLEKEKRAKPYFLFIIYSL